MGIVFRAQRSTGGDAALKVLRRELSGDETFRRRFEREGRIAAQLDHPHLVEVVDSGEANGLHYLASRFVEGETLADQLERDGLCPSRSSSGSPPSLAPARRAARGRARPSARHQAVQRT